MTNIVRVFFYRAVAFLALAAILIQSFGPSALLSIAYAQDATSSSESTITPSQSQDDIQPLQTIPSPSPEVSPSTSPTEPNSDEASGASLETMIVQNNSPPETLDLSYSQSSSASLSTDKGDYKKDETVIITGSGLLPNKIYTIIIFSDNDPAVSAKDSITADDKGNFLYSHQLDGNYRPNYKIEIKDSSGNVVAQASFTDSPTKITAKNHEGQKSDSTYTSGNITEYSEGDPINFRFELDATHGPSDGQLETRFTGDDGDCLFFDNYFALGAIEPIDGGPVPEVTVLSGPNPEDFGSSDGEWVVLLNINYPDSFNHPSGSARVNYTLKLSDDAGACSGSSQHSRLSPAGGDVDQSGRQNVPVPANQVIELPSITIIKNVDRDGDGSFEDTAREEEWQFTLDDSIIRSTDSSGQAIFSNVSDGDHIITESRVWGYEFVSGSGTNCTFSGSVATASVSSGTESEDAICIFNNGPGLRFGSITVIKDVVPDDNSEWDIQISGPTENSATLEDGDSTESYLSQVGSYTVSESPSADTNGDNYDSFYDCVVGDDSITSDEGREAEFELEEDQNIVCTFTNKIRTGSISGVKYEVNSDSSIFEILPDWVIELFDGDGNFVDRVTTDSEGEYSFYNLLPGNYNLIEILQDGWTQIFSPSGVTIEPGMDSSENYFGNFRNGSISGVKYKDENGNSEKDDEDRNLSGWTIFIDSNGNSVFDDGEQFSTTDEDGYNFSNLGPGEYKVCEVAQEGWVGTDPQEENCKVLELTLTGDNLRANFGNFNLGQISGKKYEDLNGNGEDDEDEPGLSNWTIYIDSNENNEPDWDEVWVTTDEDGRYTFSGLGPGTYRVREVVQEGWMQTDPTSDDIRVGGQDDGSYLVEMTSNANKTQRNFGNRRDQGEIIIYKFIDRDGSLDTSDDREPAPGWQFYIDPYSDDEEEDEGAISLDRTDENGRTSTGEINTGYYDVIEGVERGYSLLSASCLDPDEEEYGWFDEWDSVDEVDLRSRGSLTCTFINVEDKGTLRVVKNIDVDGDGEIGEGDIQGSEDFTWDIHRGEQDIPTGSSRELGVGSYTISEDEKEGYRFLSWSCSNGTESRENSIGVEVLRESEITCTVTNQLMPANLSISKANNSGGSALGPGSEVVYTITLSLDEDGAGVSDVQVTDLLPGGFSYKAGSWTAHSSVNGDLSIPEPVYSSPGIWHIGNMIAGELITLTYKAVISSSQDPGSYKDVVWAKGTSPSGSVLAEAQNPGKVDDTFAGTSVNVVKSYQSGTSVNIEEVKKEAGQVLGASITLPATGAKTEYVVLSSLLLISGISLMLYGIRLRRKYD